MKYGYIRQVFRAGLAFVFIIIAGSAYADTLRIGGTGVALGGMSILGDAFEKQHPGTMVVVLPSLGSSGGIKALIRGAIDISVSSREVKDAEQAQGATARLYATTPLAVVTSAESVADAVTTKDLVDMYAGVTRTWPSGERVRVVLRPQTETDTKMLRGLSDDMARAVDKAMQRPGLVLAATDQENAEILERLPGSIGLVAIGQIATERRRLKVLAHDGILPAVENTDRRSAIFVKSLYIVTSDALSPRASEFVAFVLSPQGQAILASFDHSPAR